MSESRVLWPGWKTTRQIGRGRFSTVYEIERDVAGGREKAALKVITIPQSDADIDELYSEGYDKKSIAEMFQSRLKRIAAEYSRAQGMNGSANVVSCHDIRYEQHEDGIGGDIFIKMELLTPLGKALGSDVSEEQVIRIGVDICKALVLCKKHGVIHRDIKPSNIFASEAGSYKLGDFGAAGIMEESRVAAGADMYAYMAPEVYNNRSYGSNADVYSLGLVLYWLLNRRQLPFLPLPPEKPTEEMKEQAQLRRFRGEPVPLPAGGSVELKRIVLKACAFNLKDRYQSADEMLADLTALQSSSEPARSAVHPKRNCAHGSKITIPVIAAAVVLCVALGLFGYAHCWFGHVWQQAATCTAPQTCTRCGKTEGEALGHDWQGATCTEPQTCTRCGMTNGTALGHDWQGATCTEPQTCTRCGATSGAARGHSWKDAACEMPKTCTHCGKTEGEALGHDWKDATCTEPKTCIRCGKTEGTALGHSWQAATCTEPKTCLRCGETNGTALGHDWAEASCEKQKTCTRCGVTSGPPNGHKWENAACETPKTCALCGKAEGTALGHDWKDATCTEPQTCTRCGKTEGIALGHSWQAATCTKPKTCSRCGKTEGEKLGHSWKDATTASPKTCARCGAVDEAELTVSIKEGEVISFGRYEQNDNARADEISWRVLEVSDGRALLISEYGLDGQPYDADYRQVTWADCSLRAWLNDTFLNIAFSPDEQKVILKTEIDNSDSQCCSGWSTSGGNNTEDDVFLLSDTEALEYFASDSDRAASPTAHALSGTVEQHDSDNRCRWWLRSPRDGSSCVAYVDFDGTLKRDRMVGANHTVRPCVWIDIAAYQALNGGGIQ